MHSCEVCGVDVAQVREVYRLLVDSSAPIRHAAAELVAGMLEEQGQRFIAQVSPPLGDFHRSSGTSRPLQCCSRSLNPVG